MVPISNLLNSVLIDRLDRSPCKYYFSESDEESFLVKPEFVYKENLPFKTRLVCAYEVLIGKAVAVHFREDEMAEFKRIDKRERKQKKVFNGLKKRGLIIHG